MDISVAGKNSGQMKNEIMTEFWAQFGFEYGQFDHVMIILVHVQVVRYYFKMKNNFDQRLWKVKTGPGLRWEKI